jgi:hypothetical protein
LTPFDIHSAGGNFSSPAMPGNPDVYCFRIGNRTAGGMDGESNWMEGVLLPAVYVIIGLAFFFLPAQLPAM